MSLFDKVVQPIWEASDFPILVTDYKPNPEDRTILYVNSAFTELTGYAREEAIGRSAALLDGPNSELTAAQDCEAALSRGEAFKYTDVHCRKDHSGYLTQTTIAPLLDPDGSSSFLISTEMRIASATLDRWEPKVSSPHMPMGRTLAVTSRAAPIPLTIPMPLRDLQDGKAPKHLASHPELDALHLLWDTLRDGRPALRREDLEMDAVRRWADHISIATVMPNDRFRFRLFGAELARVYGRDLTGSFFDELTPVDLWAVIVEHYKTVAHTLLPLFAPVSICNGRWYSEVSRLLLPLSYDGVHASCIMAADYSRTT